MVEHEVCDDLVMVIHELPQCKNIKLVGTREALFPRNSFGVCAHFGLHPNQVARYMVICSVLAELLRGMPVLWKPALFARALDRHRALASRG